MLFSFHFSAKEMNFYWSIAVLLNFELHLRIFRLFGSFTREGDTYFKVQRIYCGKVWFILFQCSILRGVSLLLPNLSGPPIGIHNIQLFLAVSPLSFKWIQMVPYSLQISQMYQCGVYCGHFPIKRTSLSWLQIQLVLISLPIS